MNNSSHSPDSLSQHSDQENQHNVSNVMNNTSLNNLKLPDISRYISIDSENPRDQTNASCDSWFAREMESRIQLSMAPQGTDEKDSVTTEDIMHEFLNGSSSENGDHFAFEYSPTKQILAAMAAHDRQEEVNSSSTYNIPYNRR